MSVLGIHKISRPRYKELISTKPSLTPGQLMDEGYFVVTHSNFKHDEALLSIKCMDRIPAEVVSPIEPVRVIRAI